MSNKMNGQLGAQSTGETDSSLQRDSETVGVEESSTLSDGRRQC